MPQDLDCSHRVPRQLQRERLPADREVPMHRLGKPSEVASAIYFLCSEAASYVNGTELHINGGQHV